MIGILSALAAITIPAVLRVRDSSLRVECSNNLRQIGLALHGHHGARGVFPPGLTYLNGRHPQPHMSWLVRILPFVEQTDLWHEAVRAYEQEKGWLRVPPHRVMAMVIPTYVCRTDDRVLHADRSRRRPHPAFTCYLGLEGTNQFTRDGVLFVDSEVRLADIRDGTSHTLLVGERPPSASLSLGWWYAGWGQAKDGSGEMVLGVREHNVGGHYRTSCRLGPYEYGPGKIDDPCSAFHFWSLHHGAGAHFAMADGSVHFIRYEANPLMPALASRAGHEPPTVLE